MAARTAALGALAVAWAPTLPAQGQSVACTLSQCLLGEDRASVVHFLGAFAFFGALAAFCLVLFIRGVATDAEKRGSNRIYRLCGWTIVVSLTGIAAIQLTADTGPLYRWGGVFWLETLASAAFSLSWLVKGDALRPVARAAGQEDPGSRPR